MSVLQGLRCPATDRPRPTRPGIPQGTASSQERSGVRAGRPKTRVDRPARATCHAGQDVCTVYAVSDLHADTAANRRCVEEFSALASKDDVILLAGDISDDLETVQWVFERMSDSYGAVVYVPGNHELWLRPSDRAAGLADSWAKLQAIWALAADAGVRTRPFLLHNRVWIVPLLSWHHRSWDVEPDVVGRKHAWAFSDYTCCEWPEELMGGALPGWWSGQDRGGGSGMDVH